jgi:hypothetical protein
MNRKMRRKLLQLSPLEFYLHTTHVSEVPRVTMIKREFGGR